MANRWTGGIKAGSAGVSVSVVLRKAADGTELAGVAAGTPTVTYWRQGSAPVIVGLSALASASAAWSAGGWREVDPTNCPGAYRLDLPDACWAAGADWVQVCVKAPTGIVSYERHTINTDGVPVVAASPLSGPPPTNATFTLPATGLSTKAGAYIGKTAEIDDPARADVHGAAGIVAAYDGAGGFVLSPAWAAGVVPVAGSSTVKLY